MKPTATLLFTVFLFASCGQQAQVFKIDDLWKEREQSKEEFQKKYIGKDIVVAGTYKDSKPEFDFAKNTKGYEEINVYGSSLEMVHCQVEEKDVEAFKTVEKGQGIAVKGKIVSDDSDVYLELRPCTLVKGS